jgi:hypothetical protein
LESLPRIVWPRDLKHLKEEKTAFCSGAPYQRESSLHNDHILVLEGIVENKLKVTDSSLLVN